MYNIFSATEKHNIKIVDKSIDCNILKFNYVKSHTTLCIYLFIESYFIEYHKTIRKLYVIDNILIIALVCNLQHYALVLKKILCFDEKQMIIINCIVN